MKFKVGLATAIAASAIACGGDNANSGATAKGTEGGSVAQGNMTSGNDRASLTGCLTNGDLPGTYVLRLASTGDVGTAGTPGAAATSGTTAAGGRAFRVVTESGDDLSKNVNKRVAINGFIESASALNSGTSPGSTATPGSMGTTGSAATPGAAPTSGAAGTSSSTATPGAGTTGSMASGAIAPTLQVVRARSVRQIDDQCLPAEVGPTR